MDQAMIQWLVGQAGISGLAAFALYTLNVNHQTALKREREYAESNREDKQTMFRVMSENTTAVTQLVAAIQELTREYRTTGNG